MNASGIIEKWDGILYSTYNVIQGLKAAISLPNIIKRNSLLNNKHQGERCFIIMNGPSLNQHNLSPLKNEIVFASNFFFRSELCATVEPNYYCWSDSNVLVTDECVNVLQGIRDSCIGSTLLLNYKAYERWGKQQDTYYVYCKQMPNIFSINNNLAGCSSNFGTVAMFAINAAMYMGFENIYVLGLDFEPGAFKHFTNLGEGSECTDPNLQVAKEEVCGNYWGYTKAQYESFYLRDFADKHNQRIINLNPDSCIRAFEFGIYEELFK